jgi:hypothetical protein
MHDLRNIAFFVSLNYKINVYAEQFGNVSYTKIFLSRGGQNLEEEYIIMIRS